MVHVPTALSRPDDKQQSQHRQAAEALRTANLDGLVQCPHCGYQALLDEEEQWFR